MTVRPLHTRPQEEALRKAGWGRGMPYYHLVRHRQRIALLLTVYSPHTHAERGMSPEEEALHKAEWEREMPAAVAVSALHSPKS